MAKKKKILLIEDDSATIDIYGTILRKEGFEVEIISWGDEGMKKVKEIKEGKADKPDLVLLDLILPDINGIYILEEMRKYKETEDIPVFIITNYDDNELEKMGYDLKSEKFILKTNYTPRQLTELIKERLRRKS